MPVDLRDALAEAARASSQAEVIFDAIEANLEDIPQLLAEAGATEGGGLFERSRRGPAQHRVPTTVWMSVPNVARIDELVEDSGVVEGLENVTVAWWVPGFER